MGDPNRSDQTPEPVDPQTKREMEARVRQEFERLEFESGGESGVQGAMERGIENTWTNANTTQYLENVNEYAVRDAADRQQERTMGCLRIGFLVLIGVGLCVYVLERQPSFANSVVEAVKAIGIGAVGYFAGKQKRND